MKKTVNPDDPYMERFHKVLGRWDSVAVITAVVVSVGIFRVPAEVSKFIHSPGLILFAWLVGGVVSLMGASCYAELSSSMPEAGGTYVYLRKSYGKTWAFLFGWTEFLVIRAGSVAAVAFISAEYICSFFMLDAVFLKVLAVGVVLFISLFNLFGMAIGKKLHNTLTLLTISSLLIVIVYGFFSGKGSFSNLLSSGFHPEGNVLPFFALALVPIFWTYGGWHENTFVAEETRDPTRTLPRALVGAVSFITLLYLAANFLYMYLIPVSEISGSPLIGADVFSILFGDTGRKIFEALVIAASIGAINAMIITGSRVSYAMAKDNALFGYLEKLSSRTAVPYRAILVNGIWASILIVLGNFGKLLFFTGILVWLFFGLTAAGIFILRRKFPEVPRPYEVWGYPFIPFVFMLVCAGLFINTLIFHPGASIAGLVILCSGLPVHYLSRRIKKPR